MSRIGKEPISIPSDVQVSIEGKSVEVTGPKGSLDLDLPGEIDARQEDDVVLVERPNDEIRSIAVFGDGHHTAHACDFPVTVYDGW